MLLAQIHRQLDEIKDPCSVATGEPMGMSEMGLVESVDVSDDGDVIVGLRLTSPFCEMIGFLRSEVIAKVGALPSVRSVDVRSDSGFDWSPDDMAPHLRRRRAERLAAMREEAPVPLPLTVVRRPSGLEHGTAAP